MFSHYKFCCLILLNSVGPQCILSDQQKSPNQTEKTPHIFRLAIPQSTIWIILKLFRVGRKHCYVNALIYFIPAHSLTVCLVVVADKGIV